MKTDAYSAGFNMLLCNFKQNNILLIVGNAVLCWCVIAISFDNKEGIGYKNIIREALIFIELVTT